MQRRFVRIRAMQLSIGSEWTRGSKIGSGLVNDFAILRVGSTFRTAIHIIGSRQWKVDPWTTLVQGRQSPEQRHHRNWPDRCREYSPDPVVAGSVLYTDHSVVCDHSAPLHPCAKYNSYLPLLHDTRLCLVRLSEYGIQVIVFYNFLGIQLI